MAKKKTANKKKTVSVNASLDTISIAKNFEPNANIVLVNRSERPGGVFHPEIPEDLRDRFYRAARSPSMDLYVEWGAEGGTNTGCNTCLTESKECQVYHNCMATCVRCHIHKRYCTRPNIFREWRARRLLSDPEFEQYGGPDAFDTFLEDMYYMIKNKKKKAAQTGSKRPKPESEDEVDELASSDEINDLVAPTADASDVESSDSDKPLMKRPRTRSVSAKTKTPAAALLTRARTAAKAKPKAKKVPARKAKTKQSTPDFTSEDNDDDDEDAQDSEDGEDSEGGEDIEGGEDSEDGKDSEDGEDGEEDKETDELAQESDDELMIPSANDDEMDIDRPRMSRSTAAGNPARGYYTVQSSPPPESDVGENNNQECGSSNMDIEAPPDDHDQTRSVPNEQSSTSIGDQAEYPLELSQRASLQRDAFSDRTRRTASPSAKSQSSAQVSRSLSTGHLSAGYSAGHEPSRSPSNEPQGPADMDPPPRDPDSPVSKDDEERVAANSQDATMSSGNSDGTAPPPISPDARAHEISELQKQIATLRAENSDLQNQKVTLQATVREISQGMNVLKTEYDRLRDMATNRLSGASLRFSSSAESIRAAADQLDDPAAAVRDNLFFAANKLYDYHASLRDDVLSIEERFQQ